MPAAAPAITFTFQEGARPGTRVHPKWCTEELFLACDTGLSFKVYVTTSSIPAARHYSLSSGRTAALRQVAVTENTVLGIWTWTSLIRANHSTNWPISEMSVCVKARPPTQGTTYSPLLQPGLSDPQMVPFCVISSSQPFPPPGSSHGLQLPWAWEEVVDREGTQ